VTEHLKCTLKCAHTLRAQTYTHATSSNTCVRSKVARKIVHKCISFFFLMRYNNVFIRHN